MLFETFGKKKHPFPLKKMMLRRSKLEIYIDVLKVLSQRGPLRFTHIMRKANINGIVLRECIDFMLLQNLIQERNLHRNKVVYEIALRGVNVLKYFTQLDKALPLVLENRLCQ
jgi:predicted transcriptional regulator